MRNNLDPYQNIDKNDDFYFNKFDNNIDLKNQFKQRFPDLNTQVF